MVQQIFTNNLSFCSESCFAHQAATLFKKFGFIEGLGHSDLFQGKWAQNSLSDITLEPHIQFSQTIPHFVRNFVSHTKLLAASLFQKFGFIGGLGLSDHFQGKWAQNSLSDITLEPLIQFSQATPHFVRNFVLHNKLLVYFRNLA